MTIGALTRQGPKADQCCQSRLAAAARLGQRRARSQPARNSERTARPAPPQRTSPEDLFAEDAPGRRRLAVDDQGRHPQTACQPAASCPHPHCARRSQGSWQSPASASARSSTRDNDPSGSAHGQVTIGQDRVGKRAQEVLRRRRRALRPDDPQRPQQRPATEESHRRIRSMPMLPSAVSSRGRSCMK